MSSRSRPMDRSSPNTPASFPRTACAASMFRSTPSIRTNFRAITRWGALPDVLAGIDAAQAVGLKIKINTVALKGVNEDELPRLVEWAHGRGMDWTLLEVMPLGEIGEGRLDQYLPLSLIRAAVGVQGPVRIIAGRKQLPAHCQDRSCGADSVAFRRAAV